MQFGQTLLRILWKLWHANPKYGPLRIAKYDIKDGFYRLFLRALDCLRLAVILPKYPNETKLVAIPLSCTMGWVQSPPTFCTMSETICDLANEATRKQEPQVAPHRLAVMAGLHDDLSFSWVPHDHSKRAHP